MLEYPPSLNDRCHVGDQPGRWLSQVRSCQMGIPLSMIGNVPHALDRVRDFADRGSLCRELTRVQQPGHFGLGQITCAAILRDSDDQAVGCEFTKFHEILAVSWP